MSSESLKARLAKATPGPWEVTEHLATIFRTLTGPDLSTVGQVFGAPSAALIAHAPSDLAAALKVIQAAAEWLNVYNGDLRCPGCGYHSGQHRNGCACRRFIDALVEFEALP